MSKIINKAVRCLTLFVSAFKFQKKIPIIETKEENTFLANKVALITGGSGGIGFAIAKKYVNCGCKVILAGTNEKKLEEKAREIGIKDYLVIDMNDTDSFDEKVKTAVSFYNRLDILVCSAGIHINRDGFDFINVKPVEYDNVMNINLKGTYFICQSVSKYMIKNNIHGHILLISSNRGVEPSWSPYSLSKNGINALTIGLAQKLMPHGIIVNGIAPGPSDTSMQEKNIADSIYTSQTPLERYTMPSEIAEYAAMLVSELGDTIVGDTIYMTGGRGIIEYR